MTPEQAYVLGFLTPFIVLAVVALVEWGREGLTNWWRSKQPTLGRTRCALVGHCYGTEWNANHTHLWKLCLRCGHAELLKGPSS